MLIIMFRGVLMITTTANDFLWCEKYRPKTINDCVLSKATQDTFNKFVKDGQIPHMLLYGRPGTGKTTVAKALASELNADLLFINASEESGIDVVRTKIKQFASTVSFERRLKIVLLDECDYLAPLAQPALRALLEEFHKTCRFILTANYKHRIIGPLISRCTGIDFDAHGVNKARLAADFYKRLQAILYKEGIEYSDKVLITLVKKYFPDFRKTINELQTAAARGKIDEGVLVDATSESYDQLIEYMKAKNFREFRKWIAENTSTESTRFFRTLYDRLYEILDKASIPEAVLIIADYQYKSTFVMDQEINNVACVTEIVSRCKFS